MSDVPDGADLKLIQKIVTTLAPEVEECEWARTQPLGVRWLVRSAATQLQSSVAWQAHIAEEYANRYSRN